MNKRIILFLVFVFNTFLLSAQALISTMTDPKIVSPIENIVRKDKNIKAGFQFTDDYREDLELFAAINPADSNNIVVSWMSIDPAANASNPLLFKMQYSIDGGTTWQASNINFMPHNLNSHRVISGGGDPVFAFDKNGKIHYTWLYLVANVINTDSIFLDLVLLYAYSDDKGATWTRPENDTIAWGVFDYKLGEGITAVDSGRPPDKQWMSVNPQTNDLIISTTEFYDANAITDIWGVRRIPADSSGVVKEHILVPPDTLFATTQGTIVFDKNATLHAVYPAYTDTSKILAPEGVVAYESLFYQYSLDNGQTWSDTSVVASVYVNNMTSAMQENHTSAKSYNRLYPAATIAVDTSGGAYDGRIYVVWNSNDTNFFSNVNIYLSYSDDTGKTWSSPMMVNSDGAGDYKAHHRPGITVTPNGTVVLCWYDTRNAVIPDVYDTDFYIGVSTDGGNSFSELKVNDVAFDFNDISHSFGVGEYYQIAATNSKIFVFWSEFGETGSDLEIYLAKISTDLTSKVIEYQPVNSDVSLDIYPNPVDDILNIKLDAKKQGNANILIYSIDGKLLKKYKKGYFSGCNKIPISVENFTAGQYVLLIYTDSGRFQKSFIVK